MIIDFDISGLRTINALNSREHWSKRSKRAQVERTAVNWHWPLGSLKDGLEAKQGVLVTFTRRGPRRMDDDGLSASLKAVRDAVAKRLGVDDGESRVAFLYKQEKGDYGVNVRIEVVEASR